MMTMAAGGTTSTVGLLIGVGLVIGGGLQIAFWRSSAGAAVVEESALPPKFFDAIGIILIMVGLMVTLGSLGG
jgi:hypothetical protein